VALVCPKADALNAWAREAHVPHDDWKALCANPKAKAEVLASLVAECKKAKVTTTNPSISSFLLFYFSSTVHTCMGRVNRWDQLNNHKVFI
jgi:long-subunit acyl-CoA synthetase (AMP-forming)